MNPNLTEEQITWREITIAVYKRDGWRCRHCRSMSDGITPHHIVFRSQGGKDTLDNLLTLCFICHRAVHDHNLELEVESILSVDTDPPILNPQVTFIRKNGWSPKSEYSWY